MNVPFTAKAAYLPAGEKLIAANNTIKSRRRLTFTADISALGEGKLILGHGHMQSSGSWIEITPTEILAYSYIGYVDPPLQNLLKEQNILHGLTITDFVTVNMDYDPATRLLTVLLFTASGSFKCEIPRWGGSNGDISAHFEGADAENCVLNWTSDDFGCRIWLIGDSYTGYTHPARWPYYLFRDGYARLLLAGYAGMNSQCAIADFKKYADKGKPEYMVWCLGMNNSDKEGVLNADYVAATEEFIAICEARGITPILATIPNTPKQNNRQKNAWVRASGYRYIDFERAVGSHKDVNWYPDMIYPDHVHPADNGAAALYAQVLVDFPEIMERN